MSPYIKPERREEILMEEGRHHGKLFLEKFVRVEDIQSVGELNFAITMLCKDFLEKNGKSYQVINSIIGVLECAKMELYRVVASPYEEEKRMENGDVY